MGVDAWAQLVSRGLIYVQASVTTYLIVSMLIRIMCQIKCQYLNELCSRFPALPPPKLLVCVLLHFKFTSRGV